MRTKVPNGQSFDDTWESMFSVLKNRRYPARNIIRKFSDYIFVDETKIEINSVPFYHHRLVGSQNTFENLTNIRLKLNIWGGISSKGPCDLVVIFKNKYLKAKAILIYYIFEQNLNAKMYAGILIENLNPFINTKFSDSCKIHKDNDIKHRSKLCRRVLRTLGILLVSQIRNLFFIFKKKSLFLILIRNARHLTLQI